MGVNDGNGRRRVGRLEIRADDPSLTPFAGLAVTGELVRSLRLVELIDAEIAAEARVAPFKHRRRGVTPGQLIVSLAESQLIGGDCLMTSRCRARTGRAPGCGRSLTCPQRRARVSSLPA